MNTPCAGKPRCRGFTLVELMVAILMALIVSIVIFQTLFVSESEARANAGGAGAVNRGALALLMLERDLRQAGYGINTDLVMGCTGLALPPRIPENVTVAPVLIEPSGVPGGPVTLRVMSGSSGMSGPAYHVDPAFPTTASSVILQSSRYGISVGDTIVLSQPSKDCSFAVVTALPDDASAPLTARALSVASGGAIAYSGSEARVSNLGPQPTQNVYQLTADHKLTLRNALSPDPALELVDGAVGLLAEYAKDADGDGLLEYDTNAPATSDAWGKVLAVRVGILVRSGHRERANPITRSCEETTTTPQFHGVAFALTDAHWQCYQYKLFEATVPIRNNLWRPK